jgi:hypothetical protein
MRLIGIAAAITDFGQWRCNLGQQLRGLPHPGAAQDARKAAACLSQPALERPVRERQGPRGLPELPAAPDIAGKQVGEAVIYGSGVGELFRKSHRIVGPADRELLPVAVETRLGDLACNKLHRTE